MGFDEGFMVVNNEMQRIRAVLAARAPRKEARS
jgi:methylaspartate ammonia-lyase